MPASPGTLPPPRLQRPAIKVKIITWNMGGASLPKGDLEVLLGRVGGYVPPEADWDADVESDHEHASPEESEEDSDAHSDDDTLHTTSTSPVQSPRSIPSHDQDFQSSHTSSADSLVHPRRPNPAHKSRKRKTSHAKSKGKGVPGQEKVPRHDRIPPLPHDDGHPYHLLVVAGQECPWGDGKRIATGLGVANELSDLARTKTRAHAKPSKETKDKDSANFSQSTPSSYDSRPATSAFAASSSSAAIAPTPGAFPESISQEFPFSSPPPSTPIEITDKKGAITATAPPPTHSKGIGGKGWSDMCEDWLCRGPAAQTQATKGLAATTEAILQGSVPSNDVSQDHSRASSPEPSSVSAHDAGVSSPAVAQPSSQGVLPRSPPTPNKAAVTPPSSAATPIAVRRSTTTNSNTLNIPMPSFSRSSSTNSFSNSGETGTPLGSPSPLPSPAAPITSRDFAISAATTPNKLPQPPPNVAKEKPRQLPHLQIPGNAQRDGTPQALGAYELIAKERCAMIYMAVYCWRGCRDRVRGVSRGHVKSGLLAGRVGNKGAVGVSVKLGQHRLLFVNSHLAAHEGRVQTRLDNIAKIKRELRVDTFLDDKDPRNRMEDVTEIFDHSFWMGDLNFRVDITRQHADWLVMQKRYDQALEFDQLRKVIKEGKEFRGFKEHEIAFPPTYKYDVLKTLKKPKRERTVRRILHRRGHPATDVVTSQSAMADEPDSELPSSQSHGSMMTIGSPMSGSAIPGPETVVELADETEEGLDDSSSISSSACDSFGSSAFTGSHEGGHLSRRQHRSRSSGSTGETDSDDDDLSAIGNDSVASSLRDPVVSSNTSAAQGPVFSHGAAIKAKWKIMDLVRSATGSSGASDERHGRERKHSHTSSKRSSPGSGVSPVSATSSEATRGEDAVEGSPTVDADLKRRSMGEQKRVVRHETSLSSIDSVLFGSNTDAGKSLASEGSMSVDAGKSRRQRGDGVKNDGTSEGTSEGELKRTLSSATQDSVREGEEQRYDTSAKQRVPSWTDRILWRSNVVVPNESSLHGEGLGTKMGKSFTNAMRAAGASVARSREVTSGSGAAGHAGVTAHSSSNRRASHVPRAAAARQGTPPENRMPARSQTFSHSLADGSSGQAPSTRTSAEIRTTDEHQQRFKILHHRRPRASGSSSKNKSAAAEVEAHGEHAGSVDAGEGIRSADALLDPPVRLGAGGATPSSARHPPRGTPRRTASVSLTPTTNGAGSSRPSLVQRDRSSPTLSALRVVSQPAPGDDGVNRHHARGESHSRNGGTVSGPSTTDSLATRGGLSGPHQEQHQQHQHQHQQSSVAAPSNGFLSNWFSTHVPTLQNAVAALSSLANRDASTEGGHRNSLAGRGVGGAEATVPELIGPRKGQVECLLYKSLDDREMRALEGRSDHRPVIWVGSIGI